jgi:two-component system invasion response regulator UvrY
VPVVLVLHESLTRVALRHWLESTGRFEVVGEAATAHEVDELLRDTRPAIAVVDLSLPGRSGLSALRSIRTRHPSVSVLVVGADAHPSRMAEAVRAGASGYLGRTQGADDLVRVIGSVSEGKRLRLPDLTYA